MLSSSFVWNKKNYRRFNDLIRIYISTNYIEIYVFRGIREQWSAIVYTSIFFLCPLGLGLWRQNSSSQSCKHERYSILIDFLHIYVWHIKILNSICIPILYLRIYQSLQICVLLLCIVVKDVVRGHWSCCPLSMCCASHLYGFPPTMHHKSNVIKCIELNKGEGIIGAWPKISVVLAVVINMTKL